MMMFYPSCGTEMKFFRDNHYNFSILSDFCFWLIEKSLQLNMVHNYWDEEEEECLSFLLLL